MLSNKTIKTAICTMMFLRDQHALKYKLQNQPLINSPSQGIHQQKILGVISQ